MERVYAWTIPALWVAWLGYWMYAARGVKPAVRREPIVSRLAHLGPLVLAALLLVPRTLPGGWFGVALLAGGLAFAVWARRALGGNWSGTVTLKQDHELVRVGPYRHVRHPIYTGLLLGFLGTALARDEWRGMLAVAIAWLALWRKARLEERWMVERFGDAYRRYQAEVPALLPLRLPRSGR